LSDGRALSNDFLLILLDIDWLPKRWL